MKNLLLLLPLFFFASANAQDASEAPARKILFFKVKQRATRDSVMPAGPNEISVNVAPAFIRLLDGFPSNEARFSVFYKRALPNSRTVLRAGITLRAPDENGFFSSQNSNRFIYETDSTRIKNQLQKSGLRKWQLNLGAEWRSKRKSRWTAYVAIDLLGGFWDRRYWLVNIDQVKQGNGDWVFDNGSGNPVNLLAKKNAFSWYAGFSPEAGLRYAFNRHWLISTQTGFEAYFTKEENYHRNNTWTGLVRNEAQTFDFSIPGLLNELAVVYRF